MMNFSNRDRSVIRSLALFLLASFAVLAMAGCGIFSPDESDDGGDKPIVDDFKPTGVDEVPAPQGRDNVISNLELTYELLDFPQYRNLLHADYIFRVDPSEVDIVGSAELSLFEDLNSTEAMFGGETGREPVLDPVTGLPTGQYDIVPAVQSIRLALIPDSASSWTLMEDGEFEGAYRRIYTVDMTVTYSGDSRIDQIRGKQVFYVTPGVRVDDTSGDEYWQLRAWEDQGIDS